MIDSTKRCPKCAESKPSAEFGKNRARADGLSYACSECTRRANRMWRESSPTHREKNRKKLAELYRDDPDTYLNYRYRSAYGITLARYNEMLAEQGGACAICRQRPDGQRLAVDHDHSCCPTAKKSCGKCVRGLLCARCNRGIGYFDDDSAMLKRAAAYINA